MKISELVNKIETEGFNIDCDLEVKGFISTDDMYIALDDIKQRAIVVKENGMFEMDYLLKDVSVNLALLDVCTDIEFDDEFTFEQYDLLRKHGIFTAIYDCVIDLEFFFNLCDETLEQEVKLRNSIEGLIANGIMSLLEKIPSGEEMMKYIKEFKGFNPEMLKTLTDLFNYANKGTDKKLGEKNE